MRYTSRFIRFEVEMHMSPLTGMFGGGTPAPESTAGAGEYHEATEDDLNMLAQILGG